MADDTTTDMDDTTTDMDDADVEALKQRNAELEAQLANQGHRGWRMNVALVLVVLFTIVLIPAAQVVWGVTTVFNTDNFVSTFAPLPEDPAFATALGTGVAESLSEGAQIEQRLADQLPEGIQFIAAPVAGAVEGLVAEATTAVIQSDAFTGIWEQALRFTHSSMIAILERTQSGAVQVQDGAVVLDLSPVVAEIDSRLSARGIDVIDADSVEAEIVLYEQEELGIVQTIIDLIYAVRWGAVIVVILLFIAAVAIANDRRRVASWLGIGAMVAMAITGIEIRYLHNQVIDSIADPVYAEGAEAAWSIIFDRLIAQTVAIFFIGLIAVLVAWFFGPSDRARELRSNFTDARDAAHEGREPSSTMTFLQRYGRTLQWATVGLGVVFLLIAPTRGLVVIITAVIVIAIVAGIERLGGGPVASTSEDRESIDA